MDVPGIEGPTGSSGTNGSNAYTVLTVASAVPGAPGGSVTFTVANGSWAVVGQMIVVAGPSTYRVTASSPTSITGTWQAATGDVAAGTVIGAGAGVSPSGVGAIGSLSVYASGTPYQWASGGGNAAAQLVTFGTTSPSLTITAAGTYLILAQFKLDYTGATFAASRTVTMKIRRTNNTAADLTNASLTVLTAIVTTVTATLEVGTIPIIAYVTANANDVIELWGSVSVVPTAGSLDVAAASIVALKIV